MDTLTRLQRWYKSQCNGDWEHSWGVRIGTLDNPGWCIDIDLHGTPLEGKTCREHSYGIGQNAENIGEDWLVCKVEQSVFKGYGGPAKLHEMIEYFLNWAEKNS